MTFDSVCHTLVMMRGPPAAPTSNTRFPFASSTIVGDIDDSGRLPGSILFAMPCTSPYTFGEPGFAVKSSISLLSRNPPFATVTPLPNDVFSVVVITTAIPLASTTQRFVVFEPSRNGCTSFDGVALSVIVFASSAAYEGDNSFAIGI